MDINEIQWPLMDPEDLITVDELPVTPLEGSIMPAYVAEDDQSFYSQEDLDRYNEETFWSKDELPIQKIIDILENTSTENYGAFPNYLLQGDADPLDSSTWDTGGKYWKDRYGTPDSARRSMSTQYDTPQEIIDWIDRRTAGYGNPEKGKARLLKKFGLSHEPGPWNEFNPGQGFGFKEGHKFPLINENVNLIDYYASLGNPELRREGEFWPTKKYPQLAIDALKEYQASEKSFKKTHDPDVGGSWASDDGYISFNPNAIYTRRPRDMPANLSYKKKINWPKAAQIGGHEGIHSLAWNPKLINLNTLMSKKDAWTRTMPTPLLYNLQPKKYEAQNWTPSAGHEAIYYNDALFFPESGSESISPAGYENFQSLTNWKPEPVSYTTPDRGDWGPGLHLARGGIASLV
jgi:hypothetical protein